MYVKNYLSTAVSRIFVIHFNDTVKNVYLKPNRSQIGGFHDRSVFVLVLEIE